MSNMQRDGQDFEFVVNVPMINGEPFEIAENDWDVTIKGRDRYAKVECRGGVMESTGPIHTNAEIVDGQLILYCKSSRCPFGPGAVGIEMTVYAPHEKFDEDIQVLKTLQEQIDIFLIQ